MCMRGHSKRENREIPSASGAKPHGGSLLERPTNLSEGNVGMNAFGKSDDFVVLSTQVNNAATAVAESVEGRRSPKGSFAGKIKGVSLLPARIGRHNK